ncbi:MAG: hypothetical protein QOI67_1736 [Gaiellaceae bacterium]|jgi:glycosyltransferase involved in cell wall biosynthesis|nr:hypothetical protein [Gaiellaceae bacterium]
MDEQRDNDGDQGAEPTISVCIVCRNEADRLALCLDSVKWADELIVMDLESTDGSRLVAEEQGARVLTHSAVPVVEAVRNEVAREASGDWILALDPDERVTPGLAAELRRVARRGDVDIVEIPFTHYDFGHRPSDPALRFDPKPRMYRSGRVEWPTFPNALPSAAPDRTYRIPPRDELVMIHDRNRTVAEAIERVLRYGPAQAQAMVDAGETFTARRMVGTLIEKAYRHFYVNRAAKDGVPGLMRASVLCAFHFYVWASFWQLSGARRTAEDDRFVRRIGFAINVAGLGMRALGAAQKLRRPGRRVASEGPS